MIEEISAGAVVYFEPHAANRRYLALHYPAGHWDFPKGGVEDGETEEQTARREIREETGVIVDRFVPNFRKKIEYHYRRADGLSHKQVIFFLAEARSEKVQISYEHSDYAWLLFGEALRRLSFENARTILREADEYLSKKSKYQTTA